MSDVLIVINLVILGVLAFASIILVIFVVPLLSGLRKTSKTIQDMADNDISPLIGQVKELIEEMRPKINSITQKIDSLTEDEIKPLTSNVKDITANVNKIAASANENMVKVDAMVDAVVDAVDDVVSKTQEVASLYQNKAVIPVIEMISIWDGIKKGFSVFFNRE